MAQEGGGGALGGPFMPSARAGVSQKKLVSKSERWFCKVFVQLGTGRNHQ